MASAVASARRTRRLKDKLNAAIASLAAAGKLKELNGKYGLEGKIVVP